MIPPHKSVLQAKAVSGEFGETPEKHSAFVSVRFEITSEGEFKGQQYNWTGWFGEKSAERTYSSLAYCGCTFPNGESTNLTGLGTALVPVVIEHEPYETKDGEKKTAVKVTWVNNPNGGGISDQSQMDAAKKAAFNTRMKGTLTSVLAKLGTPPNSTAKSAPTNSQASSTNEPPF